VQPVLGRRDDAGLMLPAEGVGVAPVGRRTGIGGRGAARGERTSGQAGCGNAAADQSASGDSGQDSTAAVRLESGSESAFTAFARSWT
jgi:hypothetical protein